jgi:DNA-binding transcriptional LysR family regulator
MEFDDIRAFVAVAEARSVSRAARALYLTQPAVTRRMQHLESALGVTLCDRTRRPVTLTEAGQAVLERCRRVLDAVRDVRSSSEGAQVPARELRIGVAHALTEVTLTQPVERVQRRFPRVSLSLSTGWTRDLLERVRARTLDGAVILLPDDERMPAGVDATRLGRDRLVVVARSRRERRPAFEQEAVRRPSGVDDERRIRRRSTHDLIVGEDAITVEVGKDEQIVLARRQQHRIVANAARHHPPTHDLVVRVLLRQRDDGEWLIAIWIAVQPSDDLQTLLRCEFLHQPEARLLLKRVAKAAVALHHLEIGAAGEMHDCRDDECDARDASQRRRTRSV